MAVIDPTKEIYEELGPKLRADTILTALVPANNIRPQLDPRQQMPDNAVVYGFSSVQWDRKRLRGSGLLTVQCVSNGNKIRAGEIMAIVRQHLTPIELSGNALTVALSQEQDDTSDTLVNDQNEFVVQGNWFLRFLEKVAVV